MPPFVVAALMGCVLSLSWQTLALFEGASRGARSRELALEAQYSLSRLHDDAEVMRTRAEALAALPAIRRLAQLSALPPEESESLTLSSLDDMLCDGLESHLSPGEELDIWLLDDAGVTIAHSGFSVGGGRPAIPLEVPSGAVRSFKGRSSTFWVVPTKPTDTIQSPRLSGPRAHLHSMARVFDGNETVATLLIRKTVSPIATATFAPGDREKVAEVAFLDAETVSHLASGETTQLAFGETMGRSDEGERLTDWRFDATQGIGVVVRSMTHEQAGQWREVRGRTIGLAAVALLLGLAFPVTVRHYRKRLLQLAKRMDAIAVSRAVAQKADFERSLSDLERQLRDARSSEAKLQAAHRVLEESTERFARLSHVDPLTDLANRRQFDEFLENEWRRGARRNCSISLLLIDVDYFKVFVETYGHTAGDDCLREISRALASAGRRPGDLVARLGGEEFAIVLSDTDVEGARAVAHHVRSAVEALAIDHETTLVQGSEIVTLSVGIATEQVTSMSGPAVLLHHADEALYLAKQDGRDCVRTYEENTIRIESSTGIRIPANRPIATERRGTKGGV